MKTKCGKMEQGKCLELSGKDDDGNARNGMSYSENCLCDKGYARYLKEMKYRALGIIECKDLQRSEVLRRELQQQDVGHSYAAKQLHAPTLTLGPSKGEPRSALLAATWEFPKTRGTLCWGPYDKDPTITIEGAIILGSPVFRNSHIARCVVLSERQ